MATATNYRACLIHKNVHITPFGGQSNIKQQCHCSWMLTFSDSDVNVTVTNFVLQIPEMILAIT